MNVQKVRVNHSHVKLDSFPIDRCFNNVSTVPPDITAPVMPSIKVKTTKTASTMTTITFVDLHVQQDHIAKHRATRHLIVRLEHTIPTKAQFKQLIVSSVQLENSVINRELIVLTILVKSKLVISQLAVQVRHNQLMTTKSQ